MSEEPQGKRQKLVPEVEIKEEVILHFDEDMEPKEGGSAQVGRATQDEDMKQGHAKALKCDKATQADIFRNDNRNSETFACNRYIYNKKVCDCETQTAIEISKQIVDVSNCRKFEETVSNSNLEKFVDLGASEEQVKVESKGFVGISSVKDNEELIGLTGISFESFKFLLKRFELKDNNCKVSKENSLLIFLMKMKSGLSFSKIGALLSIDETTAFEIFDSVLHYLAATTRNLVFWPRKGVVQRTMPKCFLQRYSNVRVIIDCVDFPIETPASLDNRVFCYSENKKDFTGKLLLGFTPGGFISFKSKLAGGMMSDCEIVNRSELPDLLENGDEILADKRFSDIEQLTAEKGKTVSVVTTPLLECAIDLTDEEKNNEYQITKLRKEVIDRLRSFAIFNKLSEDLFSSVDAIIHMACVLVSLQPPITLDGNKENE